MKPMIVLVDEIDGSLNLIKTNSVEKDKNHRLTAHDKASWNRFFDAVERKTYKNLILVMTTNLTLDQIDEGDLPLLVQDESTFDSKWIVIGMSSSSPELMDDGSIEIIVKQKQDFELKPTQCVGLINIQRIFKFFL